MKNTRKIGLIGFGMIGKVHAFGYATTPFYAPALGTRGKIVGVATSRLETAERAREICEADFATADWREIVDSPEIEAVDICSPNAEHLPALLAAIKAGKHIYCEKPVVADSAEAAQVRAALEASRYSGVTQVAFHLRGFPAVQKAKELLDAGRLGILAQYRCGYYHAGAISPTAPYRWKHGEKGGTILDLGSHIFDLLDYLVGLPAEVSAQSTTFHPRRRVKTPDLTDLPTRGGLLGLKSERAEELYRPVLAEDSAVVMTRGLAPSSRAKIDANPDPSDPAALAGVVEVTKLSTGAEDEMRFEINGSRGAVRFSLMDSHYLEFFDADAPEYGWQKIACGARYPEPESDFPSPKSTTGWIRAHVSSIATFLQSLEFGRPLGADLAQGLRVQDALEVVKNSVKSRRWETLDF
ncbi:MAG: Gfo/Idh/MocA family oxidoreductase [Thermoguttaceae bacterium]|nr:Gfo/Idh/MocA family oxidoreductase [Thermoguttaceae bacterium]